MRADHVRHERAEDDEIDDVEEESGRDNRENPRVHPADRSIVERRIDIFDDRLRQCASSLSTRRSGPALCVSGYPDASLDLPGLVPGIHVDPRDKPGGDDPSYFCGYFI